MKINDTSRLQQLQSYQKNNRVKDGKDSVSEATPLRDGVSISKAALDMARELQSSGADRTEHLGRVKRAIQDGTYHVSSDVLSRKLIEAYGVE